MVNRIVLRSPASRMHGPRRDNVAGVVVRLPGWRAWEPTVSPARTDSSSAVGDEAVVACTTLPPDAGDRQVHRQLAVATARSTPLGGGPGGPQTVGNGVLASKKPSPPP